MKVFHLKPWSPSIKVTAHKLMDAIHQVAPELEVLFMGAAALGLPGKNDIDLDILCDQGDVDHYGALLVKVLGPAKESGHGIVAWEFEKDGFEVDCILSDPKFSHVPEQKKVFERLESDPDALREYKELKIAYDGLAYEEYERRKKTFFKKIEEA